MAEIILPGTYVSVRDEGLITTSQGVSGNIGVVGTASKGPVGKLKILGSFTEAREAFGDSDPWKNGESHELTLIRALEQVYNNGGRTVYAVRAASSAATAAAYQTRCSAQNGQPEKPLVLLEARTPGTWGNAIKIDIESADEPAVVEEELAGNATSVLRSKVVKSHPSCSIEVREVGTGKVRRYEVVYDPGETDLDHQKPQVGIKTNGGDLTFAADFKPKAADTIAVRYAIPHADSKKVTLSYQATKESYTVADASHLAEQVNRDSVLVASSEPEKDVKEFFDELPENTGGEMLFGSDLDGHRPGNDGALAKAEDYRKSLVELENELINIVFLAGQDHTNAEMTTLLVGHLNTTSEIKRERIALIGSNGSSDADAIAAHTLNHERLIFVAPGISLSAQARLPGAYTAAAVAGLISSLPVQVSPTNKTLNIPDLAAVLSAPKLEKLVMSRVLAVEKRDGFRVVKGITTSTSSAWHQITTRRIVDYAIYGVRSACNPYIGKLNNERVRGAMKATLDAFLTRMVDDEALIGYGLEVGATRAQEIAGEAIVTMTLQPTFSIDFIRVTMNLG